VIWRHHDQALTKKHTFPSPLALARMNAHARQISLKYLDGISVPEDAVSAPNPLLVVNGRINMAAPDLADGGAQAPKIAAIEANHMVSTGRVNTRVGL
ncbi:unnamed protein product, partial [Hapterophycus canaliculatus]